MIPNWNTSGDTKWNQATAQRIFQILNRGATFSSNMLSAWSGSNTFSHGVALTFANPLSCRPTAICAFPNTTPIRGEPIWTYADGQITATIFYDVPTTALRLEASSSQSITTSTDTVVSVPTILEKTGSTITFDGTGTATLAKGARYSAWFRVGVGALSGTGYSVGAYLFDGTNRYADNGSPLPTASGSYESKSGSSLLSTPSGSMTICSRVWQNTGANISLQYGSGLSSRLEIMQTDWLVGGVSDTPLLLIVGG